MLKSGGAGAARLRKRFLQARPPGPARARAATAGVSAANSAAADLEPSDWQAKFDAIKMCPDGKKIERGEISRVARMPPAVPKETLRRRLAERDVSATEMGPAPVLGMLEEDLLEWLRAYQSMGVHVYTKVVREKARRLAMAAGIAWDFVASGPWLKAFCARHELKIREGQFLEKERAHAVTREGLGRFYDLLHIAEDGVLPEDIWMLDEVHVNLLDTGGYKVRAAALARARPPAPRAYPNVPSRPAGDNVRRRRLRVDP